MQLIIKLLVVFQQSNTGRKTYLLGQHRHAFGMCIEYPYPVDQRQSRLHPGQVTRVQAN